MFGLLVIAIIVIVGLSFMADLNYGLKRKRDKWEK